MHWEGKHQYVSRCVTNQQSNPTVWCPSVVMQCSHTFSLCWKQNWFVTFFLGHLHRPIVVGGGGGDEDCVLQPYKVVRHPIWWLWKRSVRSWATIRGTRRKHNLCCAYEQDFPYRYFPQSATTATKTNNLCRASRDFFVAKNFLFAKTPSIGWVLFWLVCSSHETIFFNIDS